MFVFGVIGELEVTIEHDFQALRLATMGPGSYFGEIALVRYSTCSASCDLRIFAEIPHCKYCTLNQCGRKLGKSCSLPLVRSFINSFPSCCFREKTSGLKG